MGVEIFNSNSKKILAVILVIIVVLNLALFAFRIINQLLFWSIIIIAAVIAYWIMPKLKKV